jgi:hypothetical protein
MSVRVDPLIEHAWRVLRKALECISLSCRNDQALFLNSVPVQQKYQGKVMKGSKKARSAGSTGMQFQWLAALT